MSVMLAEIDDGLLRRDAHATDDLEAGRLRSLRIARSESLAHVAPVLGIHPNTLARWERGVRIPGPEAINRISDYYGVSRREIVEFFDGRRTPASPDDTLRATGLRRVRTSYAVPVRVIAQDLDVPAHTIYNWERGGARMPAGLLPRLARLIGIEQGTLRVLLAQPAVVPARTPVPRSSLERWRRRVGLTKSAAARLIGCNRHTLAKWESGASMPSLSCIRAIARHYGVRPQEVALAVSYQTSPKLDPRSWRSDEFSRVVSDVRQWSGLTQRDLADRLGVGFATVRAWEAGRTEPGQARTRELEAVFKLPHGSLERARRTRPPPRGPRPAR